MDGKILARIGAVIFVAVAITATVIEMNRPADQSASATVRELPPMTRDPLDTELARCSGIGEAGGRDPACLKAWADSRRRFLGQPTPAAASAAPTPMTLFPSAPFSADPGKPAVQPEPAQTGVR
ncbi:putative entry exclusion protein TrbK-alt [Bosea sp. (in: a-proteobacteria)]|jgi:conjugative transfer region protein TrbK|uniref:putative entry exclusion protein TrbK-alt n=1 Tax=Bosea sp. (in: a-proteobacteria) TaxID=1871050 RepID=UPI0035619BC0